MVEPELLDDWTVDKYVKGRLTDGQGHYCALGWMLHKLGMSDVLLSQSSIVGDLIEGVAGLHGSVVSAIMDISDIGVTVYGDRTWGEFHSSFKERVNVIKSLLTFIYPWSMNV